MDLSLFHYIKYFIKLGIIYLIPKKINQEKKCQISLKQLKS